MPRLPTAACVLAAMVSAAAPAAGKTPVKVPEKLAKVLSAAQDDLRSNRPQQAIARLRAFRGEDHALRHLLLGHAYAHQDEWPSAEAAYCKALDMDPALRQAGVALAQVYVRRSDWPRAARLLGAHVDADACRADVLLLYAQVARELGDRRLCGVLARKGIVRFPADLRFRRLDLAVLVDAGEHTAARRAAAVLLKAAPADADLWQQLAFAAAETGKETDSLCALEAALLCEPNDAGRRRQFLTALLAAGDWLTVVKRGRALLSGASAKSAAADTALMDLLIRAADMGERNELLSAWLALVRADRRTRAMHLAAARLALRRGQTKAARAALVRLIEAGEADASAFLWAGHLAETDQDWPQAETLYAQARKGTGRPARLARLYLARLYLGRGRLAEAGRLLEQYLQSHPEDAPARAMLALVAARKKEAATNGAAGAGARGQPRR